LFAQNLLTPIWPLLGLKWLGRETFADGRLEAFCGLLMHLFGCMTIHIHGECGWIMSQCVRNCFDGDANADSFCCERMARVVEMPFQPYASADALEVVLYCGLRQIPSRFVCENKSELIVPTITCFELPFGLPPFYSLQMFQYFGRGRNLSLLAVFCFHKTASCILLAQPWKLFVDQDCSLFEIHTFPLKSQQFGEAHSSPKGRKEQIFVAKYLVN